MLHHNRRQHFLVIKEEAEEHKIKTNRKKRREALAAAYEAEAMHAGKIYQLVSQYPNRKNLQFFVLGCHGNAAKAQKHVARLMNQIAADNPPDFILMVGDNFYDHGVDTPDDPIFTTHFSRIYGNKALKHIAGIPCFPLLGNHDKNIHKFSSLYGMKGHRRGMIQVARTYLAEMIENIAGKLHFSTKDKKEFYAQTQLPLNKAPKWNMPNRYYGLDMGNNILFCIDSSAYVKDYIQYRIYQIYQKRKAEGTLPSILQKYEHFDLQKNQAAWLEKSVKEAQNAGKKVILAGHHPLFTAGKRAFGHDAKLYLSKKEQEKFDILYTMSNPEKKIHAEHASYNTLLKETFKQQALTFDTIFAAHDHDLYYYNNKNKKSDACDNTLAMDNQPICQMVAGGGGGSLQRFAKYDDSMGFFLRQHGFVACDQDEAGNIRFNVYSINKKGASTYHLVFTNENKEPLRNYSGLQDQINEIEKFCAVVKEATDTYLKFITTRQTTYSGQFFSHNISHGRRGIERATEVWAYINNYEADNLAATIEQVYKMTEWTSPITDPTMHSLITILNNKIAAAYGPDKDIASLYLQHHHGKVSLAM